MKEYVKPDFHFIRISGSLSGEEIAALSDEELAGYLKKSGYYEAKKLYQINPGYVLREIAGEYAIVPVGDECRITNAIMTPNDSAVFFWETFQKPSTMEDVVRKGMETYDAEEKTLRSAAYRFVKDALKYQILEEVG